MQRRRRLYRLSRKKRPDELVIIRAGLGTQSITALLYYVLKFRIVEL